MQSKGVKISDEIMELADARSQSTKEFQLGN